MCADSSPSTIRGSTTEPAARDFADGAAELRLVPHALLQQVRAALRSPVEEGECVQRALVLAQDDDADLRPGRPQLVREPNALVGVVRRHADVGDDDVRPVSLDACADGIEVAVRRDEVEIFDRLEHTDDPLAREIVVLGEDDPNRHRRRLSLSDCPTRRGAHWCQPDRKSGAPALVRARPTSHTP